MSAQLNHTMSHPLTPAGAAKYLGLDVKTITRWARQGYLPAHPLGEGKRKFWVAEGIALLVRCRLHLPVHREERDPADLSGDNSQAPDPSGVEEARHHQAGRFPHVPAHAWHIASSARDRHQDGAGVTAACKYPRITMEIYQQAVSAERREAQNRVVTGLSALQRPRRKYERFDYCHKPRIFCCLWRGRRDSKPRTLP